MSAILRDIFYHTDSIQKTDTGVTAQVTFDKEHPIFKGHFPDMPIVPGVCQTQMLGEILNEALGKDLQLSSAASIKFLSLVDPTKTPTLNLTINYAITGDGAYNVSSQYFWNETVFFKFKGAYR
ncbi:MAG: (3R)-hydroxymyristoyl-ACP dehydratase [Bacteroidetes bacterium]|nr:(3R)-hydroxymyristoyl-ACP dehydratase [Bacteroidota bacterium]